MESQLENQAWELDQYLAGAGLKAAISETGRPYVEFSGGRFRMNAGCGTLSGSYLLEFDRLLFSPHVASLLTDCPQVLAAQEETVLSLLSRVTRLDETAEQIKLLDADGQPLLTLKVPEAAPLQGRRWQLVAYRDRNDMIRTALHQPLITIWFESATSLAGVACDRYSATFSRNDRHLRLLGPVATSRFGCADSPTAQAQGTDFIDALSSVDSYRVDDKVLLLRDKDGRMLARFAVMEAPPDAGAPADDGFGGERTAAPPLGAPLR